MAITAVKELAANGSERNYDARLATRIWHVYSDDKAESVAIVESAVGVDVGFGLPGDDTRKCQRLRTERESSSMLLWRVTAEYNSAEPSQSFTENPLTRDPRISGDFDSYRLPIYADGLGAIANSSGQTFDTPIDEDFADPWILIERNETTLNLPQLIKYMNAVASDSVYGSRPGEAKLVGVRWAYIRESGYRYYEKAYRIAFRENFVDGTNTERSGWTKLILDEGYYAKAQTPQEDLQDYVADGLMPIRDRFQQLIRSPAKLNGRGNPIQLGTALTPLPSDYPFVPGPDLKSVFRHVPPKKVLPFSVLNLPALP